MERSRDLTSDESPPTSGVDLNLETIDRTTTTKLPVWAQQGRWTAAFGAGVKPQPFSKIRGRAIAAKRAFERNQVPLADCLSGDELLAGARTGKLWAFPLVANARAKGLTIAMPSEHHRRAYANARWKLRGTYLVALAWICVAQVVKGRAGLCISLDELGQLCGVKARRMGDVMHALRYWGLVHATPSFVAFGAVTSQRANVYRVTKLCVHVFGLGTDADAAPDMEPDVAPRIARARQVGTKMPANPESTSVLVQPAGVHCDRSSSDDRPTPGYRGSTLIASVPPPGVPPAAAVPAAAAVHTHRAAREDATRSSVGRLYEPGGADAPLDASAGRELAPGTVGDALHRVRTGRVERDVRRDRGWRRERDVEVGRDRDIVAERELEIVKHGPPKDLAPAAKLQPPTRPGRKTADEQLAEQLEQTWKSFNERKGRGGDGPPVVVLPTIQSLRKRGGGS